MSYEIFIEKKVGKFLKNIEKKQKRQSEKILFFLHNILKNSSDPCSLPNAKKLQGFMDNRYRWRLGDYRIIGRIENNAFKIIQIIKITKRDDSTYRGL
ncbi:hypothetical protein LS70_006560 [Helicobacter sp. MIT 11-5569]|uniref:type II toxin-antitoxin system RelE family toxin n=1 Tax=Helicobacter sp. MIT 11-5569 TaxID=1548151 RepID=UPI00051FBF98|nr:hypothetical protein [Helicobacter sp. MIT 11-5569]TLD82945.1 hypothetical protein LS70_006560 [Helicobacter sp. MIT 11-5569]